MHAACRCSLVVVPESSQSMRDAAERVLDRMALLNRRSRAFAATVAQRSGLQPAQVQLLFALYRASECRVADLAEQQLVDPSVASRQIASLEKAGLIARRSDPEDGRATLVSLTEAGLDRLRVLRRLHVRAAADALADWPLEHVDRLAADLEVLIGGIEHAHANFAGLEPDNELQEQHA
ncbi:winged helix-turn-helix transcriptional regulator [Georgenia yuyongxinii]|uniref:Winged helix-turn-helix transcriptional regulator n=2 Tax=Georgenia yuyongxinii TaxID=2589797 RepID=A0A552WWS6_9MICO|nr:winged helix-turn-helix transcriptional regulator [Georgenia yuyongxinii]